MNIAVIGLWQLGETFSAGIAELGNNVIGIDTDEKTIRDLRGGIPPLAEPGLEALIAGNMKEGRLRFTTDFAEVKKCEVVWFTFDTPVDDNDDAKMEIIYDALTKAIPHFQTEITLVITSQVPVGSSDKIVAAIRAERPEVKVHYAYTPENLRLGDAVRCFMEPGRIVIGTNDEGARETVERIFAPLRAEIIAMSIPSAEMMKHALNAFLATSLSFINDIADICEAEGADVIDVVRGLRSDPRIGKDAFLGAGLGFSGGTLGRDLRALDAAAKEHGIVVPVIMAAWEKNAGRGKALADLFIKKLDGAEGRRVAVFGMTYKAGTTTLRRSRSVELAERLRAAGADVRLHDPHASQEEIGEATALPFFADPYEAVTACEGIFFATPWPDFKNIDFARLAKACRAGAILFDANNLLCGESEKKIRAAGMKYSGVGRV